ncbi:MAG: hypothetical protein PVF66_12755 [Candidatus Aminicenantes bacterium]|jgi:uncharacterized protein (TIGR02001 family)
MERRIENKTLRFVLVLIPIIGISLPLAADFKYNLTYSSSYIWRGFDLNPIQKMVLQPSVDYTFGKSGLALNLWSSFSFVNRNSNEIDLTLSYTFKTSKNLRLNAGLIHYGWYLVEDFSLENDTSHEIFVSAGLPNLMTHPTVTVFYDFTNGDGFYLQLETDHSITITQSIQTELSASLGYNGGQWLAEGVDPGFSDLNIGLAVLFEYKGWNITPFVNYTYVLLDALGNDSFFWFGVGVGTKK